MLCMWYPKYPPEQRWAFLGELFYLITFAQFHFMHNKRFWRETGTRLGSETAYPDGNKL